MAGSSSSLIRWAGLVLALLLAASSLVTALGHDADDRYREREYGSHGRRHGQHGEMPELQLEKPREWFRSEGGHIRVWDDIRALEEMDVYVQAGRMTLEERGLALPMYSDAACIGYVEEGEGLVGFLTGYSMGERMRRVRRGDVVAFPRGVAHWWYNSGNTEMRIMGFADTSAGLMPGQMTMFSLAGGRGMEGEGMRRPRRREGGGGEEQMGGMLHGFRKEFLAEAWDMEEREVEELLNSQREVGIVRAEREIDVRGFPGFEHGRHHRREMDSNTASEMMGGAGRMMGDFVYNVHHGTPDVRVEDAGHATVVNRMKLPMLAQVGMGLSHARLERDAMMAPHWSPNGHRLVHVLRGDGDMEIVGNAGQRMMSRRMMEGETYVIPRFFAAGMRAGGDGMEWISFYTTDMPYVEALAGRTNVFHSMPVQVAAAAFNVDEEMMTECRKRKGPMRGAILLPPSHMHEGRRRHGRRNMDDDIVDKSASAIGVMV